MKVENVRERESRTSTEGRKRKETKGRWNREVSKQQRAGQSRRQCREEGGGGGGEKGQEGKGDCASACVSVFTVSPLCLHVVAVGEGGDGRRRNAGKPACRKRES